MLKCRYNFPSCKNSFQEPYVEWFCFLGLNDREREGQYKWADGSKAIEEEFRWLPGEPANSPPGEDCVEMYTRTNQFLWNDVPCSDELSFVCQVDWIFLSHFILTSFSLSFRLTDCHAQTRLVEL